VISLPKHGILRFNNPARTMIKASISAMPLYRLTLLARPGSHGNKRRYFIQLGRCGF